MANETLTPDGNTRNIAGAVTDDSNAFIKKLRIDDTTKGLKVLVVGGTGAGTVNSVYDGTHTVTNPSQIDFTSGAVVTDLGGGVAGVAISSGALVVGTTAITSGTTTRILYDNAGVLGEYTLTGSGTVVAMATSPTFQTSINGAYLTASTILITDGSSNIISATVATYPSLTELSYVKGVTSAVQTQLNAKQGTITFGTGVQTALGVNVGSAGAPVLFNGALGTPSSGTATNITGLPAASVLAGSLGTGAYVMDTKLTVPSIINTANTVTVSSNAGTVPITYRINNFTNSSASAMTITMAVTSAVDGQLSEVRIYDASASAKGITWVNTENSTISAPTTSNGSTTLPLSVLFQYNSQTSLWRCIASV